MIFIDLEILPLQKIVYHRISLMMYKYNNDMLPMAINELYTKNNEIHTYETRQSHHLHLPMGTHTKNFVYKSVQIWNELANKGIDASVSLPVFKRKLKMYLLHNELCLGYTE